MVDNQAIMTVKTKHQIIEQLRVLLPSLKRKYTIKSLGIFGSYVRDEATESSDLDLLVEFEPDARMTFFKILDMEQEISDAMEIKKIDTVTPGALKPFIGRQILNEVQYL